MSRFTVAESADGEKTDELHDMGHRNRQVCRQDSRDGREAVCSRFSEILKRCTRSPRVRNQATDLLPLHMLARPRQREGSCRRQGLSTTRAVICSGRTPASMKE